jgi:hypothetical protein
MLSRAQKIIDRMTWKRTFWRSRFLDQAGRPTAEAMKALRDLSTFCYGNKPSAKVSQKSGCIDPIAMGIAEGRREVFLHIVNLLNLDDAAFNRLLTQYQQENDE